MNNAASDHLRWFQFRLRTLLVVVMLSDTAKLLEKFPGHRPYIIPDGRSISGFFNYKTGIQYELIYSDPPAKTKQ
jgi:hypothetical protein